MKTEKIGEDDIVTDSGEQSEQPKQSLEERLSVLEAAAKSEGEQKKRGRKKRASEVVDMAEGNRKLAEDVEKAQKEPGYKSAADIEAEPLRTEKVKLESEAEDLLKRAEDMVTRAYQLRGKVEGVNLEEVMQEVNKMKGEARQKKMMAEGTQVDINRIYIKHNEWNNDQRVKANHPEEFAIDQVAEANDINNPFDKNILKQDVETEKTERKEQSYADSAHEALEHFSQEIQNEFDQAKSSIESGMATLDFQGDAGQSLFNRVTEMGGAINGLIEARKAIFFKDSKIEKARFNKDRKEEEVVKLLDLIVKEVKVAVDSLKAKIERETKNRKMFDDGHERDDESNRHIHTAFVGDTISSSDSWSYNLSERFSNREIAEKIEAERSLAVLGAQEKMVEIEKLKEEVAKKISTITEPLGINPDRT